MRIWNLKSGDPLSFTLAADARLITTDYCDDQIWELVLMGGDPPALAAQTTFGLRARSFRIFPRFTEAGLCLSDPVSFFQPPAVHFFSPNFSRLSYSPFSDIAVTAEYWVPESHVLAGRIKIANLGKGTRTIRFELAAVLSPSSDGQRLSPQDIGRVHILTGKTGGLAPVIFLTGGAEPITSPYPALGLDLNLSEETTRTLVWAEAGLPDVQTSFELTRQAAARNWDAESARIELLSAGQVEIYTGDTDWDAAFALAQNAAHGLMCGPTSLLPAVSFVFSRQPDFGYSLRGDGSDYNHLWSGQSLLEACYLAGFLLPADAPLAQGLVDNFLAAQNQPGVLDWKPGLGGQRGQLQATPLLASLAWKTYQVTQDRTFLKRVFSQLVAFIQAWFSPQHDRDGDGIPEWDHVLQTGFDDHPFFANWGNWSQGIDISTVESPLLCAYLYRECMILDDIAKILEQPEPLQELHAHAEDLKAAVDASWDEASSVYRHWDRDSHQSKPREALGDRFGPGEIAIRRDFDHPVRILVRIHVHGEPGRTVKVFIHGSGTSGKHLIERIPSKNLHWNMGLGSATSERVYANLERVEIQGIEESDRITLQTVGYDLADQSVLLPLWAGIPSQDRAQSLMKQTITAEDRFWQPYGIRACANIPVLGGDESDPWQSVHLPWNTAIGEGLVDYGFRIEAAELVTRLMKAVVMVLKREKGFRRYYHSQTGAGIGERNALAGLAPLDLFLKTLGVRLYSPTRVEITGTNPFPWPVTVKYRGLTVLRQSGKTTIIFSGGQAVTLDGPESRMISLE
jgi:hypothetical protein